MAGLRVLDDETRSAAAASDPLVAQLVSIRVPETPMLALGGAVAVRMRLGKHVEWCATGAPPDAADLLARLISDGAASEGTVPWAAAAALRQRLTPVEEHRWDFRWTDTAPEVPGPSAAQSPGWLRPSESGEVQRLLDEAFPTAAVQTGDAAVRRWAGVRSAADGTLLACAADVTSAADLGFISSICRSRDPSARGLGTAITAWITAEHVRDRGRAALWVDHPNVVARRVYDALGFHDEHRMVWVDVGPPAPTERSA